MFDRYYHYPASARSASSYDDPAAGDTFADVMATLSPSAWWRLGESSGASAVDEMATQNGVYDGTITYSVAGITTDGDTAIGLDGAGSVEIADNAAWDFGTSDFTCMIGLDLGAWRSADRSQLICRGDGAGIGFYWRLDTTTNRVAIRVGYEEVFSTGIPTLAGTGWHLLGLRCDRSGNAYLNIDGVDEAAVDISGAAAESIERSDALYLGKRVSSGFDDDFLYDATIDEAAVWNGTLLTEADFATLYGAL